MNLRNPVVGGFHPDPSVCRVGDDYYLATSTFEYVPAIPIQHSRDLVTWTTIGHALVDLDELHDVDSSQGIFAPTLRHIGGRFVVITTVMPDGRGLIVTAEDPAGEWSAPMWIEDSDWSMDPSLFVDDDGTVYFTRHGAGRHGGIYQSTIDLATGRLDAPPRRIWSGTGGIWPEGPHLYAVDGTYYLLISEGGTSYEHSLVVARSSSPWGPFEPCPSNPVLTHTDRPSEPIQAVGHADLVDTPDGHWWAVMLGIRPHERRHHLGRETFLAPVTWGADGWPIVNGGRPVTAEIAAAGLPSTSAAGEQPADPVTHIDFTAGRPLDLEWITVRAPLGDRCRSTRSGLVLTGSTTGVADPGTPTFLGRRQPDLDVTIATQCHVDVGVGDEAGLVLRLHEQRHIEFIVTDRGSGREALVRVTTPSGVDVTAACPITGDAATLEVAATASTYSFAVDDGSGRVELGDVATSVVSVATAESFTGVVVGPACRSADEARPCRAVFTWFEIARHATT